MRPRFFILFVILVFLPVSSAFSEEKNWTGEVSVTGVLPYIDGNKAKFNEYRDYKDETIRPFGEVLLNFDNKKGYFFDFSASDIGYDTQEYMAEGGRYGDFRYRLYYDELVHNTTWNARTFYGAPGSATLTYTGPAQPPSNPDLWNPFDYSINRKKYGGSADLNFVKPFFFTFDMERVKKDGIKHKLGTSEGGEEAVGSFGFTTGLPGPIDLTIDHVKAEVGYAKQPFFAALSYYYQRFMNEDDFVSVRNPFFNNNPFNTTPGIDTIPLEPDNDYHRFSFVGNAKLPLNSRFNAKLAWSRARSHTNLIPSIFGNPPVVGGVPTGPRPLGNLTYSDAHFDGKVETQNYHFVVTSTPLSFLEGKLFYQYYKKDNESDRIIINDGTDVFQNHLFEYTKQQTGVELDFRVMKGLNLIGGYTYYDVDREREDIPKTKDNVFSAAARYTGLPFATVRVGYEYLDRNADHEIPTLTLGDQAEANITEQFVRRFDVAEKNQNTFKVDVEFYPLDNLNLNFMYKFIKADYKETTLGITEDKRNFFGVAGDYAWKKWLKVYCYFDWDDVKWNQFQRRYNPPPGGNPDPLTGAQNATNFNWTVDHKDKNYDWGVGVDIFPVKKLTVRTGYA